MSELKVIVDLDRCEAHGQCVLAAPDVFHGFSDESVLLFDSEPAESERQAVDAAIAICPAAAIRREDS